MKIDELIMSVIFYVQQQFNNDKTKYGTNECSYNTHNNDRIIFIFLKHNCSLPSEVYLILVCRNTNKTYTSGYFQNISIFMEKFMNNSLHMKD